MSAGAAAKEAGRLVTKDHHQQSGSWGAQSSHWRRGKARCGRDAARAPDYGRCRVGAEHTRRVRHEGGVSGEDLPQRADQDGGAQSSRRARAACG